MMRKVLILSLLGLSLIGCTKPYDGPKVKIPKVEHGQMITLSGDELYEKVITDSENSIVLFGVDNCQACNDAKQQVGDYAILKSVNTYYVNITHMDEDEYNKIVLATSYIDSVYAFPSYGEEISLPNVYVFMEKAVALKFENNFVDNLLTYTEVTVS